MPGDNIPESMGEDFSESVGEDISEQAGAIISESVGGFPRNQQSWSASGPRRSWRRVNSGATGNVSSPRD
jgi:hypothetical protein